jgi:hypothetical protein
MYITTFVIHSLYVFHVVLSLVDGIMKQLAAPYHAPIHTHNQTSQMALCFNVFLLKFCDHLSVCFTSGPYHLH